MMKSRIVVLSTAAALVLVASPSHANDRYRQRPPVVVSPDLSAPWVMQLGRHPGEVVAQPSFGVEVQPGSQPRQIMQAQRSAPRKSWSAFGQDNVRVAAVPAPRKKQIQPQMDPIYLPQQVAYDGPEKPGTVVIDTSSKFLYLVQSGGQARRYGVGVGKDGMLWTGTQTVTRKAEWPSWHPPAQMIARERANGREIPNFMEGGPDNPLGARAMYLGDTLYRIHGTNAPWTIGTNVSSGCIRLRNEDVTDLYERIDVGTKVIVM